MKIHAARQVHQARQEINDVIEDVIEASCYTNPCIGTKVGRLLTMSKNNERNTTKNTTR